MGKKLLIKNIKYLVSCDSSDKVYERVNLYAEDDGAGGTQLPLLQR